MREATDQEARNEGTFRCSATEGARTHPGSDQLVGTQVAACA
jgi:hypothetical protein